MISIIIPIYNTIKYLEKCLDSVKNQTFSDWEALLIDDGCTDGCTEIIKRYCEEDSRFRYLGGNHIGFPLSKNLGLDNAKGEYICFVDSDDYIEPQYLEILYSTAIKTGADLCCCGYRRFVVDNLEPIDTAEYKVITFNDIRRKLMYLFNYQGTSFQWNKIYKRELFEGIRFKDVVALSDTMENYKIYEKANKVAIINCKLINHRVHNENMTYKVRHFDNTYWAHRLNIYKDMCNYLYEKYPKESVDILRAVINTQLRFIKPHLDNKLYNSIVEKINEDLL